MSKSTLSPTEDDNASICMKEAHGIGQGVLDQHALGVAGNQLLGR